MNHSEIANNPKVVQNFTLQTSISWTSDTGTPKINLYCDTGILASWGRDLLWDSPKTSGSPTIFLPKPSRYLPTHGLFHTTHGSIVTWILVITWVNVAVNNKWKNTHTKTFKRKTSVISGPTKKRWNLPEISNLNILNCKPWWICVATLQSNKDCNRQWTTKKLYISYSNMKEF